MAGVVSGVEFAGELSKRRTGDALATHRRWRSLGRGEKIHQPYIQGRLSGCFSGGQCSSMLVEKLAKSAHHFVSVTAAIVVVHCCTFLHRSPVSSDRDQR